MGVGYWMTARKGDAVIHISDRQGGFSNNLTVQNSRVFSEGPDIEIAMDLNGNLSSRSKQDNAYLDARDLASGGLDELSLVQVDDDRFIDVLSTRLQGFRDRPRTWYLTLELEGDHTFEVEPEFKTIHGVRMLNLHVVAPT